MINKSEAQVLEELKSLIESINPVAFLGLNKNGFILNSGSFDSLSLVTFAVSIEEKFGLHVPLDEIHDVPLSKIASDIVKHNAE